MAQRGRQDARAQGESVLLDERLINQAFKEATRGGRQQLHGLYTPQGRVPDSPEAEEQTMVQLAEQYKAKKKKQKHKAKHLQKNETELEDERVQKKAQKILMQASEIEKSQYKEIFDFFDADEDHQLGSIELSQRMTDLGYATSVETASNLLYFAGVRDVDRITFEDFVTIMPKLQAYRKVMEKDFMRHFQEKDEDGAGLITTRQLRELLMSLAGPDGMSEDQIADIMKKADPAREGRVTFENMILAIFGSKPLVPYEVNRQEGPWASLLRAFGQFCGTAPAKEAVYVSDVAPPLPSRA